MDPKEKAKELYDKFNKMLPLIEQTTVKTPSECAIVVVDEILTETLFEYTNDENHDRVVYWQLVKNELENI